MRSWENRTDSTVVDEPLYAHYLAVTGIDHPGRDEVIAAGQPDWRAVVDTLLGPVPDGSRVFYHKQMALHLTPDIERTWITRLTNVLLIREPRHVVASYLRSRRTVTADDIGLHQQSRLYDELSESGAPPPVIDSSDFLRDPEGYSRALCSHVDVPFTDAMLTWPSGPRSSDGVWGRYWYDSVWRSTGFEPYRPSDVTLSTDEAEVAESCRPSYERLLAVRWRLG